MSGIEVRIARLFRGVPQDQVKKMLHDNCKRLYHLDDIPERLPEGSASAR